MDQKALELAATIASAAALTASARVKEASSAAALTASARVKEASSAAAAVVMAMMVAMKGLAKVEAVQVTATGAI